MQCHSEYRRIGLGDACFFRDDERIDMRRQSAELELVALLLQHVVGHDAHLRAAANRRDERPSAGNGASRVHVIAAILERCRRTQIVGRSYSTELEQTTEPYPPGFVHLQPSV